MDWCKLHELVDCDVVAGMQELLRQHLAECHGPTTEMNNHMLDCHSRCPVCVVDDDPPTGLSGTMEPELKKCTCDEWRCRSGYILAILKGAPRYIDPPTHCCYCGKPLAKKEEGR